MNELELILTDICHCSRSKLYLDASSRVLNESELRRLEKILRQRARSIPVQYSLGYADFMGLGLKVNKHVLVPRPETEQLVEAVLELMAKKKVRQEPFRILDLGTGSGCIAIALAKFIRLRSRAPNNTSAEMNAKMKTTKRDCASADVTKWQTLSASADNPPKLNTNVIQRRRVHKGTADLPVGCSIRHNTTIVATDISQQALKIARHNAKLHSADKMIRFFKSDFFSHVVFSKDDAFDLIVSNPPYVPSSEIGVFDETTTKEPRVALDGGVDGCDVYRRLSVETLRYLKKDGLFIFEIGDGQSIAMRNFFSHNWTIERFIKDYRGIERICIAKPKHNNVCPGSPLEIA